MRIVAMQASHVAQVAALEQACFSSPWSARAITEELSNPLSLWLVAEQDGEVLGYIGSQMVLDLADVMNVAVAPDFRRQGIAAALITALIAQLEARGAAALSLEVRVSNDSALSLYRKLGFVQVGRRKNYYRAPKEDALILRRQWKELEL